MLFRRGGSRNHPPQVLNNHYPVDNNYPVDMVGNSDEEIMIQVKYSSLAIISQAILQVQLYGGLVADQPLQLTGTFS